MGKQQPGLPREIGLLLTRLVALSSVLVGIPGPD